MDEREKDSQERKTKVYPNPAMENIYIQLKKKPEFLKEFIEDEEDEKDYFWIEENTFAIQSKENEKIGYTFLENGIIIAHFKENSKTTVFIPYHNIEYMTYDSKINEKDRD